MILSRKRWLSDTPDSTPQGKVVEAESELPPMQRLSNVTDRAGACLCNAFPLLEYL